MNEIKTYSASRTLTKQEIQRMNIQRDFGTATESNRNRGSVTIGEFKAKQPQALEAAPESGVFLINRKIFRCVVVIFDLDQVY